MGGDFGMKGICRTVLVLVCFLFVTIFASAQGPNELYQVSTINALLQGVYDGESTIKDLEQHGNFGIGTLNSLDGELIGLDGKYYQVKASGQVVEVPGNTKIPFATVLNFKSQQNVKINDLADYDAIQKYLDKTINDQNYFYAIRIDGVFSSVKTRSIPAQTRPYKTLAEASKEQCVFEFQNIRGTVVGFWCPKYVNGVNVPGYHLHFISADRQHGGHILGLGAAAGDVQIARVMDFRMVLPGAGDFQKAALGKDLSKELNAVEK
jgi:acetolactate decarboxylase